MMILSHVLIIRGDEDPDGFWEIEHPDECWTDVKDWDGGPGYRDTNCSISGKINWDQNALDEFQALSQGRYMIKYRHRGEGEFYTDWLEIGCGSRHRHHGPHEGCPGSPDGRTWL